MAEDKNAATEGKINHNLNNSQRLPGAVRKISCVVALLALVFSSCVLLHSFAKPAVENIKETLLPNKTATDTQQELMYAFLRKIAMGPSAVTDTEESVKQRFVLQVHLCIQLCLIESVVL